MYCGQALLTMGVRSKPIIVISGFSEFSENSAVHVRDLPIPGDVTLVTDAGEIAARVLPPRVEEVVEVAETAAEGAPTEEGEEGEEAPTAAAEASEG